MTTTGADSGPRDGEPSIGTFLILSASKRAWKLFSICSRDMPSRTPFRTYFAAGRQRLQLRFSFTHCAIGTGVSAHGERNSLTYVDHSPFSRGVSALVSTPGRSIGAAGVGGSLLAVSFPDD